MKRWLPILLMLLASTAFAGPRHGESYRHYVGRLERENATLRAALQKCHAPKIRHHWHSGARSLQTGQFVAVRRETVYVTRSHEVVSEVERPAYSSTSTSVGNAFLDGLGLTAGFRWDRECLDCQPVACAPPPTHNVDPFFVGAELRLPLASRLTAFGNVDRDWTEAPHWNARLGIAYRPWGRANASTP
jgi:hypothetical protein